jgi:hypothetical protein
MDIIIRAVPHPYMHPLMSDGRGRRRGDNMTRDLVVGSATI